MYELCYFPSIFEYIAELEKRLTTINGVFAGCDHRRGSLYAVVISLHFLLSPSRSLRQSNTIARCTTQHDGKLVKALSGVQQALTESTIYGISREESALSFGQYRQAPQLGQWRRWRPIDYSSPEQP